MSTVIMDGSGFINPAELTSSANAPSSASNARLDTSPRGIKRSRSEEDTVDTLAGADGEDNDDSKPRKRGRPSRSHGPESPTPAAAQIPTPAQPVATPQSQNATLPQASPAEASPPKATPTAKGAVKALPTVRDHTLETLTPEGDEYEIRETDEAGETKVTPTGHLTNGREYRCRTFLVPNRGNKLFMLATECARALHYRDSYLLFNKNRSLHKIIATQAEKEDLIHQEILPYSYRSRQIAIVTARSMYRQFGSRMINNGRRVRDDYWEAKARKQGFTEDDLATEKRPGQSQQKKEPPTDQNLANAQTLSALAAQREQIRYVQASPPTSTYANLASAQVIDGLSPALPMIEYGNVNRPRQDITGTPYMDRTTSTSAHEIVGQASQVADFNKIVNQQRKLRGQYMSEAWNRPHEPTQPQQLDEDPTAQVTQPLASPPPMRAAPMQAPDPAAMMQHQGGAGNMMSPGHMPQQQHHPMMNQSPVQQRMMQQQMRPDQMHQRTPSYPYGMGMQNQGQMFNYPQNPMWAQQPQTPMAQQQHQMQFAQLSQSPHPQQSPHHGFMHPSQMGQKQPNPMAYQQQQQMAGMGMGYPGMPQQQRNMMQQSPGPQQYLQQQQQQQQQHNSGPSPGGMQGWPQQGGNPQQQQQQWPGQGF